MSRQLKFQGNHSRNVNDWTVVKEPGGRVKFQANGEGVYARMGFLIEFLAENPKQTKEQLGEHLHSLHPSYRKSDVDAPMKHMYDNGIVQSTGYGRATRWSLTNNGRRIYNVAQAKF